MEPLNASVATIQALLRVWILPCDSKVESSNMACLLVKSLSFRLDDEDRKAQCRALLCAALGRPEQDGADSAYLKNSVHSNRNHCV